MHVFVALIFLCNLGASTSLRSGEKWSSCWLVSCTTSYTVGQLHNQLHGWSVGRSVGRSARRSVGRSVDQSMSKLGCWPVSQSIALSVGQLILPFTFVIEVLDL